MSGPNEHHYLPVDDEAVRWGFYVTCTGRALTPETPDLPYGVHPEMYMFDYDPVPKESLKARSPKASGRILPEFSVIFITDTHTVFESNETGVIEFDGPTLLFLFPGVWHRYRPVGSDKNWMTSRWLGFNGDIAYRLLDRIRVTPDTAVRPAGHPARLAVSFDRLIDRVAANPAASPVILSLYAMELLAEILDSAHSLAGDVVPGKAKPSKEVRAPQDDLVANILDLIWTGSHRGLTMEQLCESVGANRRTMERRFREARGHSLLTEMNLCRCRRARHFLEVTDLPVKNVAWLAGFSNTEHMRVAFLNFERMTPTQYRKNHQRTRG